MARKFLYLIAILIVLVIAAAFAYRLWGVELIRSTLAEDMATLSGPTPPA